MGEEVEAKFAVLQLAGIRRRVLDLGGRLLRDRHLERNWRFDTPEGNLTAGGEVLRLRQADDSLLSYKQSSGGSLVREEIEFEVSDAEAARQLLEALGFQLMTVYEKYREVFALDDAEVMLDEMPFGCFVEIEGKSADAVKGAAARLDLRWEARLPHSYLEIFSEGRQRGAIQPQQPTFEAFAGTPGLTAEDLGLPIATRDRSNKGDVRHG